MGCLAQQWTPSFLVIWFLIWATSSSFKIEKDHPVLIHMEVLISTENLFARYETLSQLQPVTRLDNISIRIYLSDNKKSG